MTHRAQSTSGIELTDALCNLHQANALAFLSVRDPALTTWNTTAIHDSPAAAAMPLDSGVINYSQTPQITLAAPLLGEQSVQLRVSRTPLDTVKHIRSAPGPADVAAREIQIVESPTKSLMVGLGAIKATILTAPDAPPLIFANAYVTAIQEDAGCRMKPNPDIVDSIRRKFGDEAVQAVPAQVCASLVHVLRQGEVIQPSVWTPKTSA